MRLRLVTLALALAAPAARAQRPAVEGAAFVDRNGNGTRDAGEPGLAGVVVSNQDAVVVTDAAGAFRIARGPAVVGPSTIAGLTFPSGVTLYTVRNGEVDGGRFIPLDRTP